MTDWVRSFSKKYQDVGLLYDHDLLDKQRLLRIKLTNSPEPITPVTPSYQSRFITGQPIRSIARRPNQLKPRRYLLCYETENGKSERTVYEPYNSNNSNHGDIANELISGNFGFSSFSYEGERFTNSFEDLLNE